MAMSVYGGDYRTYPGRQTRSLYDDLGRGNGYMDKGGPRDAYYGGPRERSFPFMIIRVLGVAMIVLAVIIFILGIIAVALNVNELADIFLQMYGAISMTATVALAVATGVIGFLHNDTRRNLEAYRNSFLTLCVVTATYCLAIVIMGSVYQHALYGQYGSTLIGDAKTNSGIWIGLIVMTVILAMVACAGSFVACCLPGLCTPIVDNDAYVYSYDRRIPEPSTLRVFNTRRYDDRRPQREYVSRPSRGQYDNDYYARPPKKSRTYRY